jgi:hypothetical protein
MYKYLSLACIVPLCISPGVARAHHGLDFILVQTAHLPERGTAYALTRINHLSDTEDETEIEPAVLYGLNDWMAVELHAHFAKEGDNSMGYESIAPAVHFRLTPRAQAASFGLSAEYAFAHDAESADIANIVAVAGYEGNGWMAAGNVSFEKPSGLSGEWGYSFGVRRNVSARHGIGLEVVGSFENDGYGEAMVGYYAELSKQFTFNAGLGAGFDGGPDVAAHMTVIWQFR